MTPFKFKFKRIKWLFWRQETVTGYQYRVESDRMTLFFADGSQREVAKWSECDVQLGLDWVLAVKKKMEDESGQAIPLKV